MGIPRSPGPNPNSISYKPQINSRTIQGESTGEGAPRESKTSGDSTNIDTEASEVGRRGITRYGEAELGRVPVQVAVISELRSDISSHSF